MLCCTKYCRFFQSCQQLFMPIRLNQGIIMVQHLYAYHVFLSFCSKTKIQPYATTKLVVYFVFILFVQVHWALVESWRTWGREAPLTRPQVGVWSKLTNYQGWIHKKKSITFKLFSKRRQHQNPFNGVFFRITILSFTSEILSDIQK